METLLEGFAIALSVRFNGLFFEGVGAPVVEVVLFDDDVAC